VLLTLDYQAYGACISEFFTIEPKAGETIALDGKVLRGSYQLKTNASPTESPFSVHQLPPSKWDSTSDHG